MLQRMLRVDNWLDVAPLENMEEDHSFLFLKKNLMKIFFFFFGSNLRSTSPMPLVPRPFFKFSFFFERFIKNLFIYLFILKYEDLFIIKKWRRWRWRWSKSDEDLFMMNFFFNWKTYPLNENNFGWKFMWIVG